MKLLMKLLMKLNEKINLEYQKDLNEEKTPMDQLIDNLDNLRILLSNKDLSYEFAKSIQEWDQTPLEERGDGKFPPDYVKKVLDTLSDAVNRITGKYK